MDKSYITINPINKLADIETRDKVFRAFLNMLKLDVKHKNYLQRLGFLKSTIDEQLYRTVPTKYIMRRLIAYNLKNNYDLEGIPGFYQEEDFDENSGWTFQYSNGFFVPVINENNKIEALSIHLDKEFNGSNDIWFSSNGKINGTGVKNLVFKSNICDESKTAVITDNLLLGNYINVVSEIPTISFSNIANSYQILNVLENTNIENVIFVIRPHYNQNLDYIINRIFRDIIPLGYNLEIKVINNFNDILKKDFLTVYELKKVA